MSADPDDDAGFSRAGEPCAFCDRPFKAKRKEQRFCTPRCAYEGRKAESAARFWMRVETPTADACHAYTGPLGHFGHGRVWWNGRHEQAHRVAWELVNGAIPDGLCVLHDCPGGDNPACCNPRHLWLGTKGENNRDRKQKGRGKYLVGGENPQARLSEPDVVVIRRQYASGKTLEALADDFGCSPANIGCIVRRETWQHVA